MRGDEVMIIESSLSDLIVEDGGLLRIRRERSFGVWMFGMAPKGLARDGRRGVICALAEVAEVVAVMAVVAVIWCGSLATLESLLLKSYNLFDLSLKGVTSFLRF